MIIQILVHYNYGDCYEEVQCYESDKRDPIKLVYDSREYFTGESNFKVKPER